MPNITMLELIVYLASEFWALLPNLRLCLLDKFMCGWLINPTIKK